MTKVKQVVAVSGAASGIGLALVKQLLGEGCAVAASDISAKNLAALRPLADEQHLLLSCVDAAEQTAVALWAAEVKEHFGRIDAVINNAGVSLSCHAAEQPREHFSWLMNINFWGVVNGCEAFLPYVKDAGGCIVNISSLFGLLAVPSQSAYNAAKFAVRGYSESLRQDLKGSGVAVLTVHPGGIKTNIARNGRHFHDLHGKESDLDATAANFDKVARTSPERAASKIIHAMRRRRRRLLIGSDAIFLDWVQRLFPANYDRWLAPLIRLS
ncbi:SDR family NAD(P)-dependent oxidoreductase [Spongiibacter marinus]|uniref:SDR family NAD(P)-dependent oxidoreductase n=1 Tax=Spongiibacter marinus TaxID=354246 RepID=UPI0035BE658F